MLRIAYSLLEPYLTTYPAQRITEILRCAEAANKSPVDYLEGVFDGRLPDPKPSVRKNIGPFVQTMRKLQTSLEQGMGPSALIRELLDLVKYVDHLRKMHPDWESRRENVMELITFAKEVEEQNAKDNDTKGGTEDENSLDLECVFLLLISIQWIADNGLSE